MLNQLIESKSGAADATRGGLLLTTFVLVAVVSLSALTYSLFAKSLGVGSGDLEISNLIAPLAENAPPPVVKKEIAPEKAANAAKSALPVRQANILRIDENPLAPQEISVTPNTQKARPVGNFTVAPDGLETNGASNLPFGKGGDEGGISSLGNADETGAPSGGDPVKAPAPPAPPTKKPAAEPIRKPTTVSGGVINGKATLLPKPVYTAAARSVRATGAVNVQVLIDETGAVVSAKAVDGHPMLRAEAEKAARAARFSPTLLTNQPVKVSGIIVYKFSL